MSTEWDTIPVVDAPKDSSADWKSVPVIAPKGPATPPTVSPLGSDLQNVAAGAGKAVADLGRGAKQILDIPAKWLETKFPGISAWSQAQGMPSAASSAAATNADVAESRQLDAPLMGTKAGIGGNIAGNVAATMLPMGAVSRGLVNPTTYAGAATVGAAQGALQPTVEGESRLQNAAVGGAIGMGGNAAVNTVGRIAQPVAQVLSTAHSKAVDVLQKAGIPLDAAQQTGSSFLGKIRSGFWDHPFTAGAQSELQSTQQMGFNRAVLNTVGEDAAAATPKVMARASARINGVFSDILGRNSVKVTDPFVSTLGQIQQAANDAEKKPVSNLANRIIAAVGEDGTIPGQKAWALKKELDLISNTQDTTQNYYARALNSALKDQVNASLSPADQAAFTTARNQFAKLKTIEPAIDRVGGGDISAAKLANTLATKPNRSVSIYGRGDTDLVDLAQAGNMLLKDKAPNSGTASRIAMQLAPALIGGAIGGGEEWWRTGSLGGAGLGAAIGGGLGMKGAQLLTNSPGTAGYLARGIGNTPIRSILQAPQTNQAVGGALRRLPEAFNLSQP